MTTKACKIDKDEKIGQNWNPGYPPVRALHGASLRFSDESQTIGFLSAQF